MPLTTTERVRSLVGDMPKAAIQELVAEGAQAGNLLQVDGFPIRTGTFQVYISGVLRASATSSAAQLQQGVIDYTGVATAITAGAEVRITYQYVALSEDEIQSIIDGVSGVLGDQLLLAASIAANGMAGNTSRWFSYTQGFKTINKSMVADHFLSLAASLLKAYQTTINLGSFALTVASFDDSGTAFDSYDTGTSIPIGNRPWSDWRNW